MTTPTQPIRPTPPDPKAPTSRSPSRATIAIGLVVVAVLVAGAFGAWYLFLRPSGPTAIAEGTLPPVPSAPASADPASAEPSAGAASSDAPSGDPVEAGALDGDWLIDTSIGSVDDASGTFVGYRVQEELANIGAQEAVGRTGDVSGSLTIDGTTVTGVDVTANLRTLRSDDNRRDGQLGRQGIQTDQFPEATFRLTRPIELGSIPAESEEIQVIGTGELTLHGVTNAVEVPLTARLTGDVITVQGTLPILFSDYGIERPNSFIVLSIADNGVMELQLFFTKA